MPLPTAASTPCRPGRLPSSGPTTRPSARTTGSSGSPSTYNVAAREHLTYDRFLGLIATSLGTTVELVHATERELEPFGLAETDFSLSEALPYVVSTEKLAGLGYDSTPFPEAVEDAVSESIESDRVGAHRGPDRETEEAVLAALEDDGTVVGG